MAAATDADAVNGRPYVGRSATLDARGGSGARAAPDGAADDTSASAVADTDAEDVAGTAGAIAAPGIHGGDEPWTRDGACTDAITGPLGCADARDEPWALEGTCTDAITARDGACIDAITAPIGATDTCRARKTRRGSRGILQRVLRRFGRSAGSFK